MGRYHELHFPGESDDYRRARDDLLAAEIELRKHIEAVAAMRRRLPDGGKIREDYVFEEGPADPRARGAIRRTRMSELFAAGKNSLIVYSFMFGPEAETPCPLCTSLLDGLDGNVRHVRDRVNFAVVARAPVERIRDWAAERGWRHLRLLSSLNNGFNRDYYAEDDEGEQWPCVNVFRKTDDGIHHFYNAELFFAPTEADQHPRHADLIWPLWNLFDLTPEGRGEDWYPRFSYD